MDKKILLQSMIIAGSATALSFVVYKGYKSYRRELERAREEFEQQNEAEVLALKQELDLLDRQKILRDEEPIEDDILPTQEELEQEYAEEEEFLNRIDELNTESTEEGVAVQYEGGPSEYEAENGALLTEEDHKELDKQDEEMTVNRFGEDITKEEERTLRHDPNTTEALEQYTDMKEADVHHHGQTLIPLWDIKFRPKTLADRNLRSVLIDERIEFFGAGCRWNTEITFAEVMLYFTELAKFDIDRHPEVLLGMMIKNLGIDNMGASRIDGVIRESNDHIFLTSDGLYSMFGLDEDEYLDMLSNLEDESNNSYMQEYQTWTYWELGGPM